MITMIQTNMYTRSDNNDVYIKSESFVIANFIVLEISQLKFVLDIKCSQRDRYFYICLYVYAQNESKQMFHGVIFPSY